MTLVAKILLILLTVVSLAHAERSTRASTSSSSADFTLQQGKSSGLRRSRHTSSTDDGSSFSHDASTNDSPLSQTQKEWRDAPSTIVSSSNTKHGIDSVMLKPTQQQQQQDPQNQLRILRQKEQQQQRRRRHLQGGFDMRDFNIADMMSLEEGFAAGMAMMLVLALLCIICCCCSMCRGRGGGGSRLTDLLALFCCYEIFCDDNSPGCFVPMGDMGDGSGGAMC